MAEHTAVDVLAGRSLWSVEQSDCLAFLRALPADSIDLVFGSPPYSLCREYRENGIPSGAARPTEEWVAWMVEVYVECLRVCTGLVAFVVDDQVRDRAWGGGPALLMADLIRAGINVRRPCIYRRVGIPGSGGPRSDHADQGGGPDDLRNDYEWIVRACRPGKLPWADGTACGHPPKWAPGGEMSNRLSNGMRVNQWGGSGRNTFRMPDGRLKRQTGEASQKPAQEPEAGPILPGMEDMVEEPEPGRDAFGIAPSASRRRANGQCQKMGRRPRTSREPDGSMRDQGYAPPVLANPGNVVNVLYTAQEVAELLGEPSDVIDCQTGGGQMGSRLAHVNEAPFPESLATFFVRTFCKPGGIVLDCFAGSGTTISMAIRHGRRGIGCDLRQSQVTLARRRIAGETPSLFGAAPEQEDERG